MYSQKSKNMKKLIKLLNYPIRVLKVRRAKRELLDAKFLKKETEFNLILEKLLDSDYRKLHCDTKDKKYYVVGENNVTIAVNGNNNKVYLLYTEQNLDIPLLHDFREGFITKIIHKIIEEKHRESEKIYDKIQEYETRLNTRILSKI